MPQIRIAIKETQSQQLPSLAFKNFLSGIVLWLTVMGLGASCNQGSLSGSSQKASVEKSENSGGSLNEGATDDSEDEERIVDQPQEVSGAFLTCATVDNSRAKFPKDDSKETVGCALVRDNKKVNLSRYDSELEFHRKKDNAKLQSPTEPASAYAKWHIYGQLKISDLPETLASFKVRVKKVGGASRTFTFDMSKATSQKGVSDEEEFRDESPPGVTLPSFYMFKGSKSPLQLDNYPIHLPHFCENGVVNSQVKVAEKYQILGAFAEGVFDSKIYSSTYNLRKKGFMAWSLGDADLKSIGTPRCVLSGAGCLMVVALEREFYIFDKATIDADPMFEEKLLEQVTASGCRQ